MRIFGWIIGLAMLSTTQMVGSQNYNGSYSCKPYDSCCETDCCSQENYAGYVDYLYWQVCRSALDFNHDDHERYVNPHHESGFRIGAVYSCDCWDFGCRYTDFCASKTRKFEENFNSEKKDFGKFKFDAQILDLELASSCFFECCCGKLRPFAGAKFAWIHERFKDNDHYSQDNDERTSKSKFCGQGLYLGGEGSWELYQWHLCDKCIPVSFVARMSTGILNGSFRMQDKFEYYENKRKRECLYVTVSELFAGVDFSYCGFSDFDAELVIGYEVQSWQGWREFFSDDDMASLGLGGLVIRLGAKF